MFGMLRPRLFSVLLISFAPLFGGAEDAPDFAREVLPDRKSVV